MHPLSHFRHCPSCGIARHPADTQPLRCEACGFTLYVSITSATAAFLVREDGRVLFIRRAHEPAMGKLAIPGGFVDEGETAEDGLRREFQEEVGLPLAELRYLCSYPNCYDYKGVTYPVLDFFFTARAVGDEQPECLDAVSECTWLDPRKVDPSELAFPSMVYALEQLLNRTPGV